MAKLQRSEWAKQEASAFCILLEMLNAMVKFKMGKSMCISLDGSNSCML